MSNTLTEVEFRPLTIPASMDAADADEFREFTRVRNAIYREITGNDDDAMTPEALLPHYHDDPDEIRYAWVIVKDGEIIGRVGVDLPQEDGSLNAFWLVELLGAHHGLGIGSAAYPLVEKTAREHGRTVLQSWAQHVEPEEPGERLDPPTGFGTIPLDRAARFFLRHGYTLEQVERQSNLDLAASAEHVRELLAEAEDASAGYEVVQWLLPTPPELADDYAWVKSRMSTDVPAAALVFDEEVWDADRIARHDQRYVDGGTTALVTAARERASGRLVAFNELTIDDHGGADPAEPSHQEDTLVLKEHRGHRLGQLVKCAGLKRWHEEIAPLSPKVITYNAEENRPMLDINERIGFFPVGYEGAWKKVLS
ncbi:N-acetyltransferase family protein [Microbacterium sp. bgisy203]|uniref:GNAT family N-acetyltransferase n=1 Tax=Microbacterium sp. bgisy203 TaxID=3413799 RepID=UPI003D761A59